MVDLKVETMVGSMADLKVVLMAVLRVVYSVVSMAGQKVETTVDWMVVLMGPPSVDQTGYS